MAPPVAAAAAAAAAAEVAVAALGFGPRARRPMPAVPRRLSPRSSVSSVVVIARPRASGPKGA